LNVRGGPAGPWGGIGGAFVVGVAAAVVVAFAVAVAVVVGVAVAAAVVVAVAFDPFEPALGRQLAAASRHTPAIPSLPMRARTISSRSMTPNVSARLDETVRAVRAKSPLAPRVGLVLGSGLGAFADTLEGAQKIPYAELPHMAQSNVVGHAGNLCLGHVAGVPVVCMQGRVHLYEGHSLEAVVHGARTMARLGVGSVLITNAAGGLDPSWAPGDLMLVTDHVNLTAQNPLAGPNDDALGPRFPDMTTAYDPALRAAAQAAAREHAIALREGVYAWLLGPSYETPAEIRMLRGLGVHAVGMSTVPEVIALRHMRVRVAALSCVTNLAAGISKTELDHSEVEATARARRDDLMKLLAGWIARAAA
jgi:purine-nucleoside phosphorylase